MGRSPCCDKAHIHKGSWTKEEDDRLVAYIRANGDGCWRSLPKAAGLLRCGKSCRLRWINYLRPGLKRGNFTEEEDDLIINLHNHLGNKWSVIAGRLPGRTDNEIKNYWNTHIRRNMVSRGIDPATHRPILARVSEVAVSFGKRPDQENSKIATTSSCSSSNSGGRSSSGREESWQISNCRCPDVDLELSLSTPAQQPQEETMQLRRARKGKGSYFWSGAGWSKNCCSNAFSGLESGFLDKTGIQMK